MDTLPLDLKLHLLTHLSTLSTFPTLLSLSQTTPTFHALYTLHSTSLLRPILAEIPRIDLDALSLFISAPGFNKSLGRTIVGFFKSCEERIKFLEAPFPGIDLLVQGSGEMLRFALSVWMEADRLTRKALEEFVESYFEEVHGREKIPPHPSHLPHWRPSLLVFLTLTRLNTFDNPPTTSKPQKQRYQTSHSRVRAACDNLFTNFAIAHWDPSERATLPAQYLRDIDNISAWYTEEYKNLHAGALILEARMKFFYRVYNWYKSSDREKRAWVLDVSILSEREMGVDGRAWAEEVVRRREERRSREEEEARVRQERATENFRRWMEIEQAGGYKVVMERRRMEEANKAGWRRGRLRSRWWECQARHVNV